MKERIKEWLEWLPFIALSIVAMIILMGAIIFSPIASILNRIKRAIAMAGLTSEQRGLLADLSRYRMPLLHEIGRQLSDDEDYSRAQMRNPAEGYEVLSIQERISKLRKSDIEKLLDSCYKAKIAKWRIKIVKP